MRSPRYLGISQKTQTFWLHTSHEPRFNKSDCGRGLPVGLRRHPDESFDVWMMMTTDVFDPCFSLFLHVSTIDECPTSSSNSMLAAQQNIIKRHSNARYHMTLKCWRLESLKNTSPVRHVNHKFRLTYILFHYLLVDCVDLFWWTFKL